MCTSHASSEAILERLRSRIRTYENLGVADPDSESGKAAYARLKRAKILPQLYAAIARVQAGLYGICADCEGEIPEKRLQRVLAPLRCAPCQDQYEKKSS